MARKKTKDSKKEQKVVEESVAAAENEVHNEAVEVDAEAEADQTEVAPIEDKDEIPGFVDHILKVFSKYETLYVAWNGSVYIEDTKPDQRVGAILYKNPYFNNKKYKK